MDFTNATLPAINFDKCQIPQDTSFESATFTGGPWFDKATVTGDAWFDKATFTGDAWFNEATFTRAARFEGATFAAVVSPNIRLIFSEDQLAQIKKHGTGDTYPNGAGRMRASDCFGVFLVRFESVSRLGIASWSASMDANMSAASSRFVLAMANNSSSVAMPHSLSLDPTPEYVRWLVG